MPDSLRPHVLQHARPPYPSLSPAMNKFMFIASVMLSCHLILQCPLLLPSIFPSIKDFSNESSVHIRWPKYWSFSLSIPVNTQSWSPLRFTDLIALLSKGLSGVLSITTVWRHQFFGVLPSLPSSSLNRMWPQPWLWKTKALTIQTFVNRVMSLLFNTLSRFFIAFLPRSSHLI